MSETKEGAADVRLTTRRNNVFLSYRHSDNDSGWVSALHAFLDLRIRQILGVRDAAVWRDPQMGGGSALWETIEQELDSAIFISVLSPGYLNSDACLREARTFRDRAARSGGLLVDAKSRWIRIVKTPYVTADEPDFLKEIETIEVRFYREIPEKKGHFWEFSSEKGERDHESFVDTAEALSQDVCRLLQKMSRTIPKAPSGHPRVFLAETTSDRIADRAFIASELGAECDVVPAVSLPVTTIEAFEARVAEELEECALAVHVLGARFGALPEGEQIRSVPQIQFDAAARIRRLVWIPDDLTAVEQRQSAFFTAVESSKAEALEVIKSGRQAFLQHLRDVLAQMRRPAEPPALGQSVYLVSDQKDLTRPQLRELANCLQRHGFFVEQPVFEGDIEELREAEAQVLRDTTATVIYFGTARDSWVRSRRRQILKTLGELNLAGHYLRAVYLCSPDTEVKRGVYLSVPGRKLPEPGGPALWVLGDCSDFQCDKIAPLFDSLGGGKSDA